VQRRERPRGKPEPDWDRRVWGGWSLEGERVVRIWIIEKGDPGKGTEAWRD
jgi:hypothetical protein